MESHKRHLKEFLDRAWSGGDASVVDTHVAHRYHIRHDPGDSWNGQKLTREAFKKRLLESRAPFPDQRFDIVELIAEADRVAVSWMWHGTHLGDYPGFPASSRKLTMSGLTVYAFEDALLCGHWQISDRLTIYQQLIGNI